MRSPTLRWSLSTPRRLGASSSRTALRSGTVRVLGGHARVSLKELQELLGHASLAMTMRYAHLAPERLRAAVAGDSTASSAQASTQDACPAEEVLPNPAL